MSVSTCAETSLRKAAGPPKNHPLLQPRQMPGERGPRLAECSVRSAGCPRHLPTHYSSRLEACFVQDVWTRSKQPLQPSGSRSHESTEERRYPSGETFTVWIVFRVRSERALLPRTVFESAT